MAQQMKRRSQYGHKGHKFPADSSVNETGLKDANRERYDHANPRHRSSARKAKSNAEFMASVQWAYDQGAACRARLKAGVTKRAGR